uniref:Uncharacterized protein n=1 Tax=Physcomitrium patens TaxID=3218 RepID=A0A2K1L4I2_PHYPA|nr:hypothetical protein PHYPA_003742 [Physcomitrium patens]
MESNKLCIIVTCNVKPTDTQVNGSYQSRLSPSKSLRDILLRHFRY